MGSPAEPLQVFLTVLRLGEQLLEILKDPLSDEQLAAVGQLVDERQAATEELVREIGSRPLSSEAEATAELISEQQRRLEGAFRQVLAAIQRQSAEAASQRGRVYGVGSLLNAGPRPRLVDTTR